MCRAPVTFGGGIATEKFSSATPSALGWKYPPSTHSEKIRPSTSEGS